MPSAGYLIAVLAIVFCITLALRALPFAALRTIRSSPMVQQLSVWMPVGILVILAISALRSTIAAAPHAAPFAAIAIAVTIGVHLAFGRRTILSVGIGTAAYVILINVV